MLYSGQAAGSAGFWPGTPGPRNNSGTQALWLDMKIIAINIMTFVIFEFWREVLKIEYTTVFYPEGQWNYNSWQFICSLMKALALAIIWKTMLIKNYLFNIGKINIFLVENTL